MASLQSLLHRRSEAEEAEFELVRTKTLSRLTALSNGELGIAEEEPAEDAVLAPLSTPRPGSARTGSSTNSPAVLRIVAREDLVVARDTARLVGGVR